MEINKNSIALVCALVVVLFAGTAFADPTPVSEKAVANSQKKTVAKVTSLNILPEVNTVKSTDIVADALSGSDVQSKSKNLSELYFVFGQQRSSYSLQRQNSDLADFQIVLGTIANFFAGEQAKKIPLEDQIIGASAVIKNWFGSLVSSVKAKGSISFDLGFLPKETSMLADQYRAKLKDQYLSKIIQECENDKAQKINKINCREQIAENAPSTLPQGFDTKRNLFEPFFISKNWQSLIGPEKSYYNQIDVLKHLTLIGGIANVDTLHEGKVRAHVQLLIRLPSAAIPIKLEVPGYAYLNNFIVPSGTIAQRGVYALIDISLAAHPKFFADKDIISKISLEKAMADVTFGTDFWINPKEYGLVEIRSGAPLGALTESSISRWYSNWKSKLELNDFSIPYVTVRSLKVPRNTLPKYWPGKSKYVEVADHGKLGIEGFQLNLLSLKAEHVRLRAQLGTDNSFWNSVLTKMSEMFLKTTGGLSGAYLDKLVVKSINQGLQARRNQIIEKIDRTLQQISDMGAGLSEAWYLQNKSSSFLDYSGALHERLCEGMDPGTLDCK